LITPQPSLTPNTETILQLFKSTHENFTLLLDLKKKPENKLLSPRKTSHSFSILRKDQKKKTSPPERNRLS